MTNRAHFLFTYFLFGAYVGIHKVRILFLDKKTIVSSAFNLIEHNAADKPLYPKLDHAECHSTWVSDLVRYFVFKISLPLVSGECKQY